MLRETAAMTLMPVSRISTPNPPAVGTTTAYIAHDRTSPTTNGTTARTAVTHGGGYRSRKPAGPARAPARSSAGAVTCGGAGGGASGGAAAPFATVAEIGVAGSGISRGLYTAEGV